MLTCYSFSPTDTPYIFIHKQKHPLFGGHVPKTGRLTVNIAFGRGRSPYDPGDRPVQGQSQLLPHLNLGT